MKAVQLGDFFSRGKVDEFLSNHLTFAEDHQSRTMATSLHLSFEDATHTLGLQEMDQIRWIVAPGTLLLSGLPGDPEYPFGWAQTVGIYASAFIRPRNDNQVVIYSKSHELPIHVNIDHLDPATQEWGTSKGLLKGIIHSLRSLDNTIQGFDGFIDSPMEPGSGFSTSAVFSALMIHSLIPDSTSTNYKQLSNLLPLTDAYVRAEKDFFGSITSGLPLLASILGGTVITCSTGIQTLQSSDSFLLDPGSRSWRFYLQPLPLPQELLLQHFVPTRIEPPLSDFSNPSSRRSSAKAIDQSIYLEKIIQSRNSWHLNRENLAYLRAIRAIQTHRFAKTPYCFPYTSSSRELRQLLTILRDDESLGKKPDGEDSNYLNLFPGTLLRSEDRGTRDLVLS